MSKRLTDRGLVAIGANQAVEGLSREIDELKIEVERLQILVAWTRGFTLRRSDLAIEHMGFPTGEGFVDWFDDVVAKGRALIDKAEREVPA